uniref:Uncharacterized protein n=1 Tax=Plectus sambesii TaxID=2011161 RepID=A0A914WLB6_9BILA
MQPTGQMQSSFTPTSHNLTTFPPANGMTMMMHSQQQTTMAPNSQQMAFPVYFSSPNFAHSNDSLSSAPNCGNTTDSFYHQQNIQMGMQLLNITPVPQQQQQQLSFSFPINQNVQSHVIQNQLIQSSTMQQQQQAVMQPPMIYPTSRHLSQQQHPQQAFVIPLQQKTTRRSPQSHVNQNFQG